MARKAVKQMVIRLQNTSNASTSTNYAPTSTNYVPTSTNYAPSSGAATPSASASTASGQPNATSNASTIAYTAMAPKTPKVAGTPNANATPVANTTPSVMGTAVPGPDSRYSNLPYNERRELAEKEWEKIKADTERSLLRDATQFVEGTKQKYEPILKSWLSMTPKTRSISETKVFETTYGKFTVTVKASQHWEAWERTEFQGITTIGGGAKYTWRGITVDEHGGIQYDYEKLQKDLCEKYNIEVL